MAVSAAQVASAGFASIVAGAVSQGGQAMRRVSIFRTVFSLLFGVGVTAFRIR